VTYRLAWSDIRGFVYDVGDPSDAGDTDDVGPDDARGGTIWVTGGHGRHQAAFPIQSDFHRTEPAGAESLTAHLNHSFGLIPSSEDVSTVRKVAGLYSVQYAAYFLVSLIGFGFLTPFALAGAAVESMSMWLWYVAVATFDLAMVLLLVAWTVPFFGHRAHPALFDTMAAVWVIGLWLGPTVAFLVLARRAGMPWRPGVSAGVDEPTGRKEVAGRPARGRAAAKHTEDRDPRRRRWPT
jgi:uncharacterized membrane protein YGL010W